MAETTNGRETSFRVAEDISPATVSVLQRAGAAMGRRKIDDGSLTSLQPGGIGIAIEWGACATVLWRRHAGSRPTYGETLATVGYYGRGTTRLAL